MSSFSCALVVLVAFSIASVDGSCLLTPVENASLASSSESLIGSTIAEGTTITANCLPGFVSASGNGATSFSVWCNNSMLCYSGTPCVAANASCTLMGGWCDQSPQNWFSNTQTPGGYFQRTLGTVQFLYCNTGYVNFLGAGSGITVICGSLNNGSAGAWVSEEACVNKALLGFSGGSIARSHWWMSCGLALLTGLLFAFM